MTDPLADMLTRIRNAYLANKPQVSIPHSKIKLELAHKLNQLDYVGDIDHSKDSNSITIDLKYKNKQPAITTIHRVSKPGRRVYVRTDKIKPTLSGHGATILTTNIGILTDQEARQKRVGGEIICQVW